ncbi:27 kDa hemolymph glycoprotein-like [Photinus pyralis]|uniref:27 kDa hemolymph glycoprotein-like n=1 Tax=Photinus pyralis TaxID=7054 RepID=UPI0012670290|nr:27 kDa hemolymph glycoprotein-like [Photinus pyralis]
MNNLSTTLAMKYLVGLLLLLASARAVENHGNSFVKGIANAIEETCKRNGGEFSYDNLVKSVGEMSNFTNTRFSLQKIKDEVKRSRTTGDLNEVVGKYCDLRVALLERVHAMMDGFANCVEVDKRNVFTQIWKVTDGLVNFVCESDGERIVSYIVEDGFQCVNDKWVPMQKCGSAAVDKFSETWDACRGFTEVQQCVVKTMSNCSNSIPATILDELLNFLYISQCSNLA